MSNKSSSHRLFGKFFTNSTPPSLEETEQSLRKQWSLFGSDMTVQKQDDNDMFMFEFKQQKDKYHAKLAGPFNVNGVILVLKDPDYSKMIDFTLASFRVLVVGLPPYLFTKAYFPTLESQLGGKEYSVLYERSSQDHTLMTLRVKVDLKKPLRPGYYLNQNRFVEFKYWNLGDFCYSCGRIGHVKENCDQFKFPKERSLNATSTTHAYGPWLRFEPFTASYETGLMKIGSTVLECEKTLSYPQFCIEIEFNNVFVRNLVIMSETESTHRFRFPSSYLDSETEVYEVIRREIYENKPFSFSEFEDKPEVISSLVERLKLIHKNEFCSDDKWLTLKLQINRKYTLTPVDYETMLAASRDRQVQGLIKRQISNLIKRRVEENANLLCLSSWEREIRQVYSAREFTHYLHLIDVSKIAYTVMLEAVRMEISSSKRPIPADRSTVSGLERFKVLGSDMDRLDPCLICAGEMFLGEEETVLPCSHVFHSSCIEKWLEVGHKCPLCGFELPTEEYQAISIQCFRD